MNAITPIILDRDRIQSARMLADSRLMKASAELMKAAEFARQGALDENHAMVLRGIRDAAQDMLDAHGLIGGRK